MSKFRRDEIKRTLDQMRDGLTFIRQETGKTNNPEAVEFGLHGTSFAAAFIDLIGGMAADLNEINEKLDKSDN